MGVVLALAIGALGADAARAQDGGASGTAGGAAKPGAATVTAQAVIEDQFNFVMTVEDPSFFKPASGFSFGGGGRPAKLMELRVYKGAHEIIVPLAKITRIDVGAAADQDLLQVTITLAGGRRLEGKVDRDLEVHGRVQDGRYEIKVEKMKSISIRA